MRLSIVLLAGCMHVSTSGDPSADLGELYVCDSKIVCPGVEPFETREYICGHHDAIDEVIAEIDGRYPDCTVEGYCVGAGTVENGGTGIPRPCLMDEP